MSFLVGWSMRERHVVLASYLSWSLDAFDFFVLVFVLPNVAANFGVGVTDVALALTLTLAFRPLGAFIFGRLADHYGRRSVLMANIAIYSLFGFLTGFAPSLTAFFVIRSLFGVAMGGVWGIGASLAFETIRYGKRGFVSGLMQSGYATGYLAASLAFGILYAAIGWRGMFMVAIVPATVLILYIWKAVEESPAYDRVRGVQIAIPTLGLQIMGFLVAGLLTYLLGVRILFPNFGWYGVIAAIPVAAIIAYIASPYVRSHWRVMLYAVVLMTAFNFLSHGTQDIYPLFLQKQRGFSHGTVSTIAVIYNFGAIIGGLIFGMWSQRVGRRRAAIAAALIAVPVVVLWAFSPSVALLASGAFLMQFLVQGAWSVVPAYLNEISPRDARATFPGTVYQLGNLIASVNAVVQTGIAVRTGGNYALALAAVAVFAALMIAICMSFGPEARDVELAISR